MAPQPSPLDPPPDQSLAFLRMRILKPTATSPGVAVICALPVRGVKLFNHLRHFRLAASYIFPAPFPSAPGDLWAATLIVRDNTDNEEDGTATVHVGATHQVREGGQMALGVGQVQAQPPPTTELIPFDTAYPPSEARTFELETDVDCVAREGRSRLRTPGHEWQERRWQTPFDANDPAAPKVRSVGVGVAMVAGSGRVTTFKIIAWP